MRIACVHIPQLSLQCVTRIEPSLRGAALVVVGSAIATEMSRPVLAAPIVLACSRAAWALGVRLGMTATTARALSPDVRVVHADPTTERETVRGLADALMAIAPTVDAGGRLGAGGAHLAMYIEVPAKTRGAAFGERVIELAEGLGLSARVGIADDRFTAWVAASSSGDERVISVPRGGAAAYLAPKPLSLLAITPEVQHMLESLGVRTLGEFATLPAPSVARPIDRDYQALARGEAGAALRPYTPDAPIREEIALGGIEAGLNGIDAVVQLARRISLRLAGRGRVASKLEVVRIGGDGETLVPVSLARGLTTEVELAEAIAPAGEAAAWRLRVVVTGEALESTASGSASGSIEQVVAALERAGSDRPIDVMAVVLSNPGTGDLFGATLGATPPRDVHRRMKRGKHRRRVMTPASSQARLFERS